MLEPEFDPTVYCQVCHYPLKFTNGYYIHDWPRVARDVSNATSNNESGVQSWKTL